MATEAAQLLLRRIEELERRWRRAQRLATIALAGGLLLLVGWAPITQGDEDAAPPKVDPLSQEILRATTAGRSEPATPDRPRPPQPSDNSLSQPAAERLVIGEDGSFSILLEGGPDAARIAIRDRDKRTRSLMELTDSGIIFRIVDKNSNGRFDLLITDRQIGALGDNEARLKISDVAGNDAVLLVSAATTQGLVVVSPDGNNKTVLANTVIAPAEGDAQD